MHDLTWIDSIKRTTETITELNRWKLEEMTYYKRPIGRQITLQILNKHEFRKKQLTTALFAIFTNPIIQLILGGTCIKTMDIQFTEA